MDAVLRTKFETVLQVRSDYSDMNCNLHMKQYPDWIVAKYSN